MEPLETIGGGVGHTARLHRYAYIDMLLCMRTTIELNDELLRAAKREAAKEQTTLRAVVERALRTYLARPVQSPGYSLKWRTERGRLQPGVKLDDRDALFDLMEGRS